MGVEYAYVESWRSDDFPWDYVEKTDEGFFRAIAAQGERLIGIFQDRDAAIKALRDYLEARRDHLARLRAVARSDAMWCVFRYGDDHPGEPQIVGPFATFEEAQDWALTCENLFAEIRTMVTPNRQERAERAEHINRRGRVVGVGEPATSGATEPI